MIRRVHIAFYNTPAYLDGHPENACQRWKRISGA